MADDETPKRAFGRGLNVRRRRELLTQEDFAAQVGIAQSTLSGYESGETEPLLSTAVRMAEILGVSIEELAAAFSTEPDDVEELAAAFSTEPDDDDDELKPARRARNVSTGRGGSRPKRQVA